MRVASSGRDSLGACWEREDASTTLASKLGLAPPLIAKDLERGVMIFPFLPSKKVDLKDTISLENAVDLVRRLHMSGVVCSHKSDPEQLIQDLLKHNLSLKPEIEALLERRPKIALGELVPCHLDLHAGNILDDGSRLWLIDWEYGGMSDPLFDLAILSSTEFFNDEEMRALLYLYKPDFTPEDWERLFAYRILADLRWGLWAVYQQTHSSLDTDYYAMADNYFSQANKRLLVQFRPVAFRAATFGVANFARRP